MLEFMLLDLLNETCRNGGGGAGFLWYWGDSVGVVLLMLVLM